jgi:hypothetical protein
MESSLQKVGRLVGALETLSDQAFGSMNSGDYPSAIPIQHRAQLLIDEISRLMVEPGLVRLLDPTIRTQVDRLLKEQLNQLQRIKTDKSAVCKELQAIRVAHSRTQLFRSAYGRNDTVPSPPGNYAETG